MRLFALAALALGSLLATTSVQAHTPPATLTSVTLESSWAGTNATADVAAFTGPIGGFRGSISTARPSFSPARPSYSGFRSTPSARTFSTTPSRTFTFRSAPQVAATPKPAATYSRPAVTTTHVYHAAPAASAPAPAASPSGGISVSEAILLNQALAHNHDHSPSTDGASLSYQDSPRASVPLAAPAEESHFWRNTLFVVLGLALFGAILVGCAVIANQSKTKQAY